MSFSLIVPIAANKKEYKKQIPEEFLIYSRRTNEVCKSYHGH